MVQLIQAEGFFPPGDAQKYRVIVDGLKFQETPFGMEIPNFQMVFPHMEPMFSKVIGERVKIDSKRSGVFRKPSQIIHFEDFDSLDEWCFIVALEHSTLNIYHHLADDSFSKLNNRERNVDAKTALDGYKFNYRNLFEWDVHTNILLEPNQGIFFRPWIFHGLEEGLVQYYRLIADRKFRILITGLPGSLRPKLAQKLHEVIDNSIVLRSADIRKEEKDIDFTNDGRMRHTYRMLDLARERKEDFVIIDMVCPLPEMRQLLNADLVIWVNDIDSCEYEEVNQSFIPPKFYDMKCNNLNQETIEEILNRIVSKQL
jgi:hypothetical protein